MTQEKGEKSMPGKIAAAAKWIWNWALILAVTGVFPLAIAPVCALLFFKGPKTGMASRIALCVWCSAAAVVAAGLAARFAVRIFRLWYNRGVSNGGHES